MKKIVLFLMLVLTLSACGSSEFANLDPAGSPPKNDTPEKEPPDQSPRNQISFLGNYQIKNVICSIVVNKNGKYELEEYEELEKAKEFNEQFSIKDTSKALWGATEIDPTKYYNTNGEFVSGGPNSLDKPYKIDRPLYKGEEFSFLLQKRISTFDMGCGIYNKIPDMESLTGGCSELDSSKKYKTEPTIRCLFDLEKEQRLTEFKPTIPSVIFGTHQITQASPLNHTNYKCEQAFLLNNTPYKLGDKLLFSETPSEVTIKPSISGAEQKYPSIYFDLMAPALPYSGNLIPITLTPHQPSSNLSPRLIYQEFSFRGSEFECKGMGSNYFNPTRISCTYNYSTFDDKGGKIDCTTYAGFTAERIE